MNALGFLIGAGFGFAIAATRLSDYDVIHNMLLLREPDVFLLMASAIGTAMPLLWLLQRRGWKTALGGPLKLNYSKVERKHITGGILLGTGWAAAGTCPGPALAMTVGGTTLGLVVMVGLTAGLFLRDAVAVRDAQVAAPSGAPTRVTVTTSRGGWRAPHQLPRGACLGDGRGDQNTGVKENPTPPCHPDGRSCLKDPFSARKSQESCCILLVASGPQSQKGEEIGS
ncbi:MAG: YeeE/YedE family protein [Armatimonadetes bacterium]|nr:YeeE/YedE family protein [Armatimonadota bacterium]